MIRPRKQTTLAGLILVLATISTLAAQDSDANDGYRLGPQDLLQITVFEVEELRGIELRISDDGNLQHPVLGLVRAEGRTEAEFAADLKEVLESRYVQRATVDVQVTELRSKPISVIGAVNRPGNLPYSGRWTLLSAITAVGGLAANHGDTIYVHRRAENGLSDQVSISVYDLMVTADPDVNIPIFVNDLINVPADVEITIYCLGEVEQPGAVSFKSSERISLLAAIARAGGLTERAGKSILIKRSDEGGRQQELTIDYRRVIAGKDDDVALREGDVIVVRESFF